MRYTGTKRERERFNVRFKDLRRGPYNTALVAAAPGGYCGEPRRVNCKIGKI